MKTKIKNLLGAVLSLLVTFGIIQSAAAQTTCIDPPAGLVAWWRGEGNAQDSVGSHHGALQGGVSFVAGKVGQALSFNGAADSFITLPNSPDFVPVGNQLTIDAWIKPDFTAANEFDTILTKRDGCSGSGIGYFLGVGKEGSGYAPGTVFLTMSTASGDAVIPSGDTVVPNDGQFHHVAGTFDGAMMRVYLDGQLIGQAARAEPILPTTSAPVISHHGGSCSQRAVAVMDEIGFYNRALSDAEIQAIYAAGSAGKCIPVLDTDNDGVPDATDN